MYVCVCVAESVCVRASVCVCVLALKCMCNGEYFALPFHHLIPP